MDKYEEYKFGLGSMYRLYLDLPRGEVDECLVIPISNQTERQVKLPLKSTKLEDLLGE